MISIDLSSAPKGTTHYGVFKNRAVWFRVPRLVGGPPCYIYTQATNEWLAMADVSMNICRLNAGATLSSEAWNGEGLPPVGATVRIVLSGMSVWKDAEFFLGSDVKVVALFEISDGKMVVVQHPDGACCCFRAEMVRTPEQIVAEEREKAVEEMLSFDEYDPDKLLGMMSREDFCRALHDAGYRKTTE